MLRWSDWMVWFVLAAVLVSRVAVAQDTGFGLGIILGEPTGISGKLWLEGRTAIDGAIAWSFDKDNALYVHGDYLLHHFGLSTVEKGDLALHYGIGGRVRFEDDGAVGIRIPVGVTYIFARPTPLDLFLEIVPLLELAPRTELGVNGGFGVRFFFR